MGDAIEDVLNEREKTHGNYPVQSATAQRIKDIICSSPNWPTMPDYMKESLDLIATKISRMCHGNAMEVDTPRDIGGYAQLIVRELEK